MFWDRGKLVVCVGVSGAACLVGGPSSAQVTLPLVTRPYLYGQTTILSSPLLLVPSRAAHPHTTHTLPHHLLPDYHPPCLHPRLPGLRLPKRSSKSCSRMTPRSRWPVSFSATERRSVGAKARWCFPDLQCHLCRGHVAQCTHSLEATADPARSQASTLMGCSEARSCPRQSSSRRASRTGLASALSSLAGTVSRL